MHADPARGRGVYGVRKVHAQLARQGGVDGRPVSRRLVERLMRADGLRGAVRGRTFRTTRPWSGMAFTAFVSDSYSRRIVGWRTALAADIAAAARVGDGTRRAGPSQRWGQSIRCAALRRSAHRRRRRGLDWSVGHSYDNAQAESLIGLYKTECVRPDGPRRGVDDLELATLNWVHWFNHQRLHSSRDHRTPIEGEQASYRQVNLPGQPLAGELTSH